MSRSAEAGQSRATAAEPSARAGDVSAGALAAEVVDRLAALGASIAVAESVTGGRVASALTGVSGASTVLRGAVVAYATDVKASVLGVDPQLLAERGPVCSEVALAMAAGVRDLLGATMGVATTGEAGPQSGSGQPVGTVHIAVAGSAGPRSVALHLDGDRAAIQTGSTRAALALLAEVLGDPVPDSS
ncbi:MAG: CinA family protein [Candidatus Nanopelagicales bacterium]